VPDETGNRTDRITVFSTGTCGPFAVGNPLKIDQWMMAQTVAPSDQGSTIRGQLGDTWPVATRVGTKCPKATRRSEPIKPDKM
jgi:hypothetical protein